MTAKRLVVLILAVFLMVLGILWVARANQFNRALLEADLSAHQDTTLPSESLLAFLIVGSTAAIAGFVGTLFFLVASILLSALICKLRGRLKLIPAGILLLGWIVIFLV